MSFGRFFFNALCMCQGAIGMGRKWYRVDKKGAEPALSPVQPLSIFKSMRLLRDGHLNMARIGIIGIGDRGGFRLHQISPVFGQTLRDQPGLNRFGARF